MLNMARVFQVRFAPWGSWGGRRTRKSKRRRVEEGMGMMAMRMGKS
jgi:hypothetical protein